MADIAHLIFEKTESLSVFATCLTHTAWTSSVLMIKSTTLEPQKDDFVEPRPPGNTYSRWACSSISRFAAANAGAIIDAGNPLYFLGSAGRLVSPSNFVTRSRSDRFAVLKLLITQTAANISFTLLSSVTPSFFATALNCGRDFASPSSISESIVCTVFLFFRASPDFLPPRRCSSTVSLCVKFFSLVIHLTSFCVFIWG